MPELPEGTFYNALPPPANDCHWWDDSLKLNLVLFNPIIKRVGMGGGSKIELVYMEPKTLGLIGLKFWAIDLWSPGSCSGNAGGTLDEVDACITVDMGGANAWNDEKDNDRQMVSSVM